MSAQKSEAPRCGTLPPGPSPPRDGSCFSFSLAARCSPSSPRWASWVGLSTVEFLPQPRALGAWGGGCWSVGRTGSFSWSIPCPARGLTEPQGLFPGPAGFRAPASSGPWSGLSGGWRTFATTFPGSKVERIHFPSAPRGEMGCHVCLTLASSPEVKAAGDTAYPPGGPPGTSRPRGKPQLLSCPERQCRLFLPARALLPVLSGEEAPWPPAAPQGGRVCCCLSGLILI